MYDKVEVEAYDCRCEKCGHTWTSYKVDPPTHCASKHCTNPTKWNEPKQSRRYNATPVAVDPVRSEPVSDSTDWIDIGEHWNEITGEMVAMERHYKTGQTREKTT
jgi:hypothetical protein